MPRTLLEQSQDRQPRIPRAARARSGSNGQPGRPPFTDLRSDEPPALGGTDSAPNPVEQLLAALGNCLAVGYAANATARGIELTDLRIKVTGDLDLHSFLGLRPGHAGFQAINADVHLQSNSTPDQISDLHDAVIGSSPVGHTLQSAIPVQIHLA